MQRDERAYLNDIIEARAAIERALSGLDLATYRADRLVRSAVEREFIIVEEAVAALSRVSPQAFAQITHARRIVAEHPERRPDTKWSPLTTVRSSACWRSTRRTARPSSPSTPGEILSP